MQDQADACQLESKSISPSVTPLPPTKGDENSENLKCDESESDKHVLNSSTENDKPEEPNKLDWSKQVEVSDQTENDLAEKEESNIRNEKDESPLKVINKDELIVKMNEQSVEANAESLIENNDKSGTKNESNENTLEVKSKKIIKRDEELAENLKLLDVNLSEKKDEVLPSLGILPEVESSNGANTSNYKSARLSPPAESSSATSNDPSEVAHKVKRIKWKDSEVPIITQNNNGPCPLLAILNAMILKSKITLPRDRQELTGGELVSIVGNAVFDVPRSSVPSEMHSYLEQNTQDAVSILHKLLTGLDVNVKFSGVKDFEFTSELSIFDVLEVSLYHGWVVEPTSEAASLIANLSYNQLTNNIIMWRDQATSAKDDSLLLKAMICEEFICDSVSQLTIHGLFELGAALADDEVAVLFRNNHFSTIYKKNGQLYQLLTDQGFLLESAVWETLTDIDATFSEFVNEAFQSIHQECASETSPMTKEQQISSDHQLAAMLQQEADKQQRREEDFNKIVEDLGLHNLSDEEIAQRLQNRENQLAEESNRSPSQPPEEGNEPGRPYSQSQLPTSNPNKRKKDLSDGLRFLRDLSNLLRNRQD